MYEENPDLKLACEFLQNTGENVFLTGKAGTGKTTFLHNFRRSAQKRMAVLAPTGVAAINARGVTIHSFFQLPFGPQIPGNNNKDNNSAHGKTAGNRFHHFNREKLNIIRSLDMIVIDEISMVRADLLDGIDEVLRRFRDRNKPFGGVQLLMIGDLQQLAPVVKDDEWEILRDHYETPFFFSSKALKLSSYVTIELKQIYRQNDPEFIDLLNRIRYGDKNRDTLDMINKRYIPGFNIESNSGIILTTHNYQAQRINDDRMRKLAGEPVVFTAAVEGNFPEYNYPTDFDLTLKTDAQVMFVKNDSSPDKRYYNGKIGTIQKILDDTVYVKCPDDDSAIPVSPDTWQNTKYSLNKETNEITEAVDGTFRQYPLKAAWAITIHKSQGLTFDNIVIDAGAAFAHGQVYVALSRCRSLQGLVLTTPLSPRTLINDASVLEFSKGAQENQPGETQLYNAKINYQQSILRELFDFTSLRKLTDRCSFLFHENRERLSVHLIEKFEKIASDIKSTIIDVGEKFNNQITHYFLQEADFDRNSQLQERTKKAAAYFLEKIDLCISNSLQAEKIDIDNSETKKVLTESFKRLDEELIKKKTCLDACRGGFSIKEYLQARATSVIEKVEKNPGVTGQTEYRSDTSHPLLYEQLKSWRAEKADSMDLPHYMILPYKTMAEICSCLPSSLTELKAIKGMGSKKLKSFGSDLLEIINKYCSENNISHAIQSEPDEKDAPATKTKQNTKQISFDLFKTGKTIAEIAEVRSLTVSTIEGHLSHYIETGELNIDQFLTPGKVSQIRDFFMTNNTMSLTPAKEHFGDLFSYGELRMALAHMRYIGEETSESIDI